MGICGVYSPSLLSCAPHAKSARLFPLLLRDDAKSQRKKPSTRGFFLGGGGVPPSIILPQSHDAHARGRKGRDPSGVCVTTLDFSERRPRSWLLLFTMLHALSLARG